MFVKNDKTRDKLSEGRTSGMAFAFAKKKSDKKFETIMPVSPCKDYLNEVIYTENTGVPTSAYGFSYPKKQEIFNENVFLVIKMVPTLNGSYAYNKSLEEDAKQLKNNREKIEALLNKFEEALGLTDRTCIFEANDDYFLVKAPIDWKISTHSISMYTLILRAALTYNGECNIEDFLSKYDGHNMESGMIKGAKEVILQIIKDKKLPEQKRQHNDPKLYSPHNYGILDLVNFKK